MNITGGEIPAVFLVKDGKIIGRRDKITLSESEIEGFLNNNQGN